MKKIVKSAKIKGENELLNQSHYFAIFYGGSNLFPALRIEDITSGIRYYRFLCEIDAQLEQDAAPVIAKLKKTAELLILHSRIWRLLWAVRRVKGRLYRQKSTPSVRNYLRRNKSILYTILFETRKGSLRQCRRRVIQHNFLLIIRRTGWHIMGNTGIENHYQSGISLESGARTRRRVWLWLSVYAERFQLFLFLQRPQTDGNL